MESAASNPLFAEANLGDYMSGFADLGLMAAAPPPPPAPLAMAAGAGAKKATTMMMSPQQQQQQQQVSVSSRLVETREPDWARQNEEVLRAILQSTADANVKMHVGKVLRQFSTAAQSASQVPPRAHFVSHISLKGEALADSVKLRCSFELTVLRSRWASIRLLPGTVALSGAAAPTVQFRHASAEAGSVMFVDPPPGVTVGVVQGCYCLVAQAAGDYRVEVECLVPFSTSRKTSFELPLPRSSSTVVEFSVHEPDILIKVDPSLHTEKLPQQGSSSSSSSSGEAGTATCTVRAQVPPSPVLQVNWTEDKAGGAQAESTKVAERLNAIAVHEYLAVIGEGVVALEDTISFEIHRGQLALIELGLDEETSVISVESGSKNRADAPGIKRWEVAGLLLRVWLDFGTDSAFELKVSGERALRGASARFSLPRFKATATEGVAREKGNLAVDSDSGTEVQEFGRRKGCVLVDRAEIPSRLLSQTSNILFSYKYIVSDYQLSFDVKKHTDFSVLIATVGKACHQATVSPGGGVIYRSTYSVSNTQKQFLEVTLPFPEDEIRLWSTILISRPVKPATSKGKILIPLKKSSAASGSEETFIVELTYLHDVAANKLDDERGELSLAFPQVDLPTTGSSFFEVRLPKGFKWEDFEGLKEVSRFSGSPPTRSHVAATAPFRGGRAAPQAQQANMMYDSESESESEDEEDDDDYSGSSMTVQPAPARPAAGDVGKGLLPVDVEFPQVGNCYKFQEPFRKNGVFKLTMQYEAVDLRKSVKRSLNRKKICGVF